MGDGAGPGLCLRIEDVAGRSVPALRSASLELDAGDVLMVHGPNGSGKSTLLGVIDGRVRFRGTAAGWATRRPPSVVLDRLGWRREDTAAEAVGRFLRDIGETACAPLLDARLGQYAIDRNSRIRDLSLGMRQRLRVAVALGLDRDLFLLDEPFRPLDSDGRNRVLADMVRLKRYGRILVVATHRPDLLMGVATRSLHLGVVPTPSMRACVSGPPAALEGLAKTLARHSPGITLSPLDDGVASLEGTPPSAEHDRLMELLTRYGLRLLSMHFDDWPGLAA